MAWYDKKWVIILFLVILWPIGLFMMWRSPTFRTKTKGLVTTFFVFIFVLGAFNKTPPQSTTQAPPAATKVEDKAQPAQVAAPVQQAAPTKVTNLGMTLEQFKAAYNAKIREISQDVDWDLSSVDLIYGQYDDTFEYAFSPDGILFGTIDKNTGLVKEVCVMSSPKDQLESAKMFFAYTVLILTLSPELTVEQRRALLDNLKLLADRFPELELSKGMAVRGKVRYTTRFSGGVFLLTATAKDL